MKIIAGRINYYRLLLDALTASKENITMICGVKGVNRALYLKK